MRRLVLIALLAVMLGLAGCAEDGTTGDAVPVLEDGDSDGADESDEAETGDAGTGANSSSSTVDGELEIHHIDVGQADATLLVEPSGETMLIDSGDWRQDGSDVIEYLEARDIDRIDHLVATHGHADHIGGHAAVIEHFETERDGVGTAYDSGVAHTSRTYENYLDAIEEHDVELLVVESGDSFAFGETRVDVLNPPAGEAEGSEDDLHANSVAFRIEFGDFTYLTTGDAGFDAERRMVDEHGSTLDADVYQAGHHGSSTSSTEPFLERVSPEVAIVSSAYDSQYGHPHDEVLASYAERDIETYWTSVHGDVVLTTDGTDYEVESDGEFSTDPADLLEEKPDDEEEDDRARVAHATNVPTVPLAG